MSSLNFVLNTHPRHLTEKVPTDEKIVVDLMVDLNRNEFKESHVMLYNMTERKNVAIKAEYKARTIKILPINNLEPNMHYQVELLGGEGRGLKTITGRFLEESYVFEFYTKDTDGIKPPLILSPTHLSEVNADVTFQWEPVKNAFYYELQISNSNTFDMLIWPRETGTHVYDGFATPDIAYIKGPYYARMRTVDRDKVKSSWSELVQFYYDGENEVEAEENAVEIPKPVVASTQAAPKKRFNIESKGRIASQPTELEALQQLFLANSMEPSDQLYVSKTTPKHNALNLKPTSLKEIVIEFSDKVDPDSLTRETVYLIAERN